MEQLQSAAHLLMRKCSRICSARCRSCPAGCRCRLAQNRSCSWCSSRAGPGNLAFVPCSVSGACTAEPAKCEVSTSSSSGEAARSGVPSDTRTPCTSLPPRRARICTQRARWGCGGLRGSRQTRSSGPTRSRGPAACTPPARGRRRTPRPRRSRSAGWSRLHSCPSTSLHGQARRQTEHAASPQRLSNCHVKHAGVVPASPGAHMAPCRWRSTGLPAPRSTGLQGRRGAFQKDASVLAATWRLQRHTRNLQLHRAAAAHGAKTHRLIIQPVPTNRNLSSPAPAPTHWWRSTRRCRSPARSGMWCRRSSIRCPWRSGTVLHRAVERSGRG